MREQIGGSGRRRCLTVALACGLAACSPRVAVERAEVVRQPDRVRARDIEREDSRRPDRLGDIERVEDLRQADSALLVEALERGHPEEAARAALAMGRIQSAGYAARLARAARGADRRVRLVALFGLGQLGLAEGAQVPEEAEAAVTAALGDPDLEIVAAAVEALGKLAPEQAAATLTPLLGHADAAVREEAAHALFRLRFVPVWRGQSEEPPALPQEAVAALSDALSDDSVRVRRAAAHAFARYGQPEASDALAGALSDEDEWVRLFAARALGRSGKAGSTDRLVAAVADRNPRVRAEAVTALAALGAIDRAPLELARDESFHVRAALARGLAESKRRETLDPLASLEQDDSTTVAGEAIIALARRRRSAYRGALERHLAGGPWTLRVAATRAARHLEAEGVGLLERALSDTDSRVRVAALEVLAEGPGQERRIAEALSSADLAVRGTAISLIAKGEHPDKLARLAAAYRDSSGDEWIEVRESLVEALADLKGAETLLAEIASADPAPSVRRKARTALVALGREAHAEDVAPAIDPSPWLGRRFAEDPVVVLETTKGVMRIRCLAGEAPIHVASFIERVGQGFYDDLIWHRVVSNFVIQGGDPRGDGWGGAGYLLRDEIHRTRFERGTVGMPKAGKDTGGGQIFITQVPTPHLDGNYTVFGLVVSGIDVVDRIENGDRIVSARVE